MGNDGTKNELGYKREWALETNLMANTSIQWTDKVWNPVRGCSMAKGSEKGGCLNCYAARMASRNLPELRSPTTGESFARIMDSGPRWTGKVELIESKLTEPLHWRKPAKIFVNSMSDLFHENLPDADIDRIFAVMALCPQHCFQVLTKRPERMVKYFDVGFDNREHGVGAAMRIIRHGDAGPEWPLPNVHLGVSVEDQKTADERIPHLLATPAAKKFISYEPALEAVDFVPYFFMPSPHGSPADLEPNGAISQCIIGGESGPGARPFHVEWARSTIRQCREAGVAVFCKQLGAHPIFQPEPISNGVICGNRKFKDRAGSDIEEWPTDLQVREFPL